MTKNAENYENMGARVPSFSIYRLEIFDKLRSKFVCPILRIKYTYRILFSLINIEIWSAGPFFRKKHTF